MFHVRNSFWPSAQREGRNMNMAEAMMVRALTETGAGLDMTKYILRQTDLLSNNGSYFNDITVFSDIPWDWCLIYLAGYACTNIDSAICSESLTPVVRSSSSFTIPVTVLNPRNVRDIRVSANCTNTSSALVITNLRYDGSMSSGYTCTCQLTTYIPSSD